MSKNLNHVTTDFIKVVQVKIGLRNLHELENGAKNILAEYSEISALHRQIDNLICEQLDLADRNKTQRVVHWQEKGKSNWIELHEIYHQKRDDYSRKIDNFLNHYYSFTNFLSEIIYQSLSHEAKRNINSGTFHEMFNSVSKQNTHLLFPLANKATEIIQINNYRSKELNHRKLPKKTAMTVNFTGQQGKGWIELKPIDPKYNFDAEVAIPDDAPDDIVIQTLYKDDKVVNTTYIVHMMVGSTKLKAGDSIHFNPIIPFDYYKHLEKFGNHWHVFARPGHNVNLFQASGEVLLSTPDLWASIVLLQKFLQQVSEILK